MEYLKFLPLVILALAQAGTFAVAQDNISDNKIEIEKLKLTKEQQIRIEERQKVIKDDVNKIDTKLDNIENLIRGLQR